MRREGDSQDAPPSHVLLFATLGAPPRAGLLARRKRRAPAEPEPDPVPVSTGRATVISVEQPFEEPLAAARWLSNAGENQLIEDLRVLNGALHAFRLVTADPFVTEIGRHHVLVARIGYGAGEEVADGRWSEARELLLPAGRSRRAKVLQPRQWIQLIQRIGQIPEPNVPLLPSRSAISVR